MPFKSKMKNDALRKRHSSALKKAYKVIKGLRKQNAKLHTDKKTAQRKLLRMKKKISSDTKATCSLTLPEATSPNSKTNFEIRKQGLSPSKKSFSQKKTSI